MYPLAGLLNSAAVGSAEEVADDLIACVEKTDIDGFNLSRIARRVSTTLSTWSCPSSRSGRLQARLPARHLCARSCSPGRGCCPRATRLPRSVELDAECRK